MTQNEFKDLIRAADSRRFVRHELFDHRSWLFEQSSVVSPGSNYAKLRGDLADLLDINPRAIAIVGSAKFGWSMHPEKGFRPFDNAESDVDVVIVSSRFFNDTWRQYREAFYSGAAEYKSLNGKDVFSKFVTVRNDLKYSSAFVRDLSVKLLKLNQIFNRHLRLPPRVVKGEEVPDRAKYRIYDDWDDAERYHVAGIDALQAKLGTP